MINLRESLLNNTGLGKKSMIEKWLQNMGVENYIINNDMTIDVRGDVILAGYGLKEFPFYIQFNKVSGVFDCSENQLTSLRGCPYEVGNNFICTFNQLTTLEGAPKKVKGLFYCFHNKLTTLEGAPREINGNFDCSYNDLKSLKGSPELIIGYFDCSNNKLISLEGIPKKITNFFDCSYNEKKFTINNVLKLCNVNKHKIYSIKK